MNINVHETIRIQGNTFMNIHEKAFFKILPPQNRTKVKFIDNSFSSFENGFLKSSKIFVNLKNLDLSNITLFEECSCNLEHNIIAKQEDHKTSVQSHLDLEKLLVDTIKCIDSRHRLE